MSNAGAVLIDWCPDEEADLKRLWTEGKSGAEIMRTLNAKYRRARSRNSVIGKVHRLGLDGRITPSRPVRRPSAVPPVPTQRTLSEKRRAAGQAGAMKTHKQGGRTVEVKGSFRFGAVQTEPTPERKAGIGKDRVRNPRLLPGQTPADGRPITELRDCECRYALTADAPHRFCGRPSVPGESYCRGHIAGLFQATPAPRNPHAREKQKD